MIEYLRYMAYMTRPFGGAQRKVVILRSVKSRTEAPEVLKQ